jgi:hypothetical protein
MFDAPERNDWELALVAPLPEPFVLLVEVIEPPL